MSARWGILQAQEPPYSLVQLSIGCLRRRTPTGPNRDKPFELALRHSLRSGHMVGMGSDKLWVQPMRRRCPVIAMKSVKGLVARQKRKETGPRMSGRIGTGGTDRSAKEDASFREGGSCFGSAYWPWLSPATSATRSIVLVLKKTSAGKGLSAIRYAIGCVASREPPFSSFSWSEMSRAGHNSIERGNRQRQAIPGESRIQNFSPPGNLSIQFVCISRVDEIVGLGGCHPHLLPPCFNLTHV